MRVVSYLKLVRPVQWLKNLMLYFPPFLAGLIFQPGMAKKGILPFASFCLVSSSTYVLNDILDRENDSHHPLKMRRPIPSGAISLSVAYVTGACLLTAALFLAVQLSSAFLVMLLAYLAISVSYSLKLKELPILDLFCISAGFLLRLQAGGEAFGIIISQWLFLCVFLLSLFLSTGKRLCERNILGDSAGEHRKSLVSYPDGFLEGTLYLTGATVLVTYIMYSFTRYPLVYTVPLCTFGLLRYIFRVKTGLGGDPTESLLRDLPLFVTGVLWAVLVGWSVYR